MPLPALSQAPGLQQLASPFTQPGEAGPQEAPDLQEGEDESSLEELLSGASAPVSASSSPGQRPHRQASEPPLQVRLCQLKVPGRAGAALRQGCLAESALGQGAQAWERHRQGRQAAQSGAQQVWLPCSGAYSQAGRRLRQDLLAGWRRPGSASDSETMSSCWRCASPSKLLLCWLHRLKLYTYAQTMSQQAETAIASNELLGQRSALLQAAIEMRQALNTQVRAVHCVRVSAKPASAAD